MFENKVADVYDQRWEGSKWRQRRGSCGSEFKEKRRYSYWK